VKEKGIDLQLMLILSRLYLMTPFSAALQLNPASSNGCVGNKDHTSAWEFLGDILELPDVLVRLAFQFVDWSRLVSID
jgi:hypothetical protein